MTEIDIKLLLGKHVLRPIKSQKFRSFRGLHLLYPHQTPSNFVPDCKGEKSIASKYHLGLGVGKVDGQTHLETRKVKASMGTTV
jgi:hypothetical protein